MKNDFEKVSLKKELLSNLVELGFDKMTPVQEKALPLILAGKDIIAQAKTGSGKTAAFALPLLNWVDTSTPQVQSLVLCPTRELAEQVAKEIRTLGRMLKNVKVLTISGGVQEIHQETSLGHGAHIIVGTPGRVLRLIRKKVLILEDVSSFVLDEADRMLGMGFYDDIMKIEQFIPKKRQTMLFSATFPDEIEELGSRIQRDISFLMVDTEHKESSICEHFYRLGSHRDKNQALLNILGTYKPERLIIFCKTKRIVDDVCSFLVSNEIFAAAIHGDMGQNERTCVLTKFSNRSLSILVATDVAARGLDIKELAAVINFDLPGEAEIYTHRIGRTGRADNEGLAFSLFVAQEEYKFDEIKEISPKNCVVHELPGDEVKYDLVPPMRTVYIGGGKKNKLRPGDILGALTGEASLNANEVGSISIFNILSYVAIEYSVVEQTVKKLQTGKIKNKKFKVGLA